MKLFASDSLKDSEVRFMDKSAALVGVAVNEGAGGGSSQSMRKRCNAEAGKDLGACKACVYTIERIKSGFQNQLPAICVEIHKNVFRPSNTCWYQDENSCYHTLDALDRWGIQVKSWIAHGCYKVEVYGQVEKITPCPSHVICAQLQDPEKVNFCQDPLPELSRDVGKKTTWNGAESNWSLATQLPTSLGS